LKSIYNNQGNIAIYPSTTKLEVGGGYRIHSSGKMYERVKNNILNAVKKESDDMLNNKLYIATTIIIISNKVLYQFTHYVIHNNLNTGKYRLNHMLNNKIKKKKPICTITMSKLYPFTHEVKQKEPLIFLEMYEDKIRKIIEG